MSKKEEEKIDNIEEEKLEESTEKEEYAEKEEAQENEVKN